MTTTAKMKAQAAPETVRVRATLAVLGMARGDETTVAMTPMVQGALDDGKLVRVDDEPEPKATKTKRARGNGQV
jgi:hypothetical protein